MRCWPGLVCNLIEDGKSITTTLAKAKAASRMADKMVTLGKRGDLAARRRAISKLRRAGHVKLLFDKIAPEFTDREGGYTRIIKLGQRKSDGAEMAMLEWVFESVKRPKKKKEKADAKPKENPKDDTGEKKAKEPASTEA